MFCTLLGLGSIGFRVHRSFMIADRCPRFRSERVSAFHFWGQLRDSLNIPGERSNLQFTIEPNVRRGLLRRIDARDVNIHCNLGA
jgi:hypothetical protein